MLITIGKVRQGITQIDAREFPDGTTVTILAQEDDEPFKLAPQENAKLLAAIGEATRGEVDTAEQIVKNLVSKSPGGCCGR